MKELNQVEALKGYNFGQVQFYKITLKDKQPYKYWT